MKLHHRRLENAPEPESEVLLRTGAVSLPPDDETILRDAIPRVQDWNRIAMLAIRHGTAVLLEPHVRRLFPDLRNDPVLTALRQYSIFQSIRNEYLTKQYVEFLSIFRKDGIACIAFKGPPLGLQAYGDLAIRPFRDFDVIVDPEDFPRVHDLLRAAGYVSEPRDRKAVTDEFMRSKMFRMLSHEQTYSLAIDHLSSPDSVVPVDIHWQVAPPYVLSIKFDELLKNCVEQDILGVKVNSIRPELQVIALIAHATKHQWREMKWLVDVKLLAERTPSFKWMEVYEWGSKFSLSKKVDLALLLIDATSSTTDAFIKNRLADITHDKVLTSLCQEIVRSWLQLAPSIEDNLRNYFRFELLTFDSVSKQSIFLFNSMFRPDLCTYEDCPLPEALSPLYYAIHPSLLALRYLADKINRRELSST